MNAALKTTCTFAAVGNFKSKIFLRLRSSIDKQCRCTRIKARAHNHEILELLPKKLSQLDVNSDHRQIFWGLYARQQIHFFRVLMYNVICITPMIWFFFMWLFVWGHDGDQQNASVPLMMMMALLSLFWAMFITSSRQNGNGEASK